MKINYFKVLVFLSLVFLLYYMYKKDIFFNPKIYSPIKLGISFFFLFIGFLLQAKNWHQILKPEFKINYRQAIVSTGLSVFTKYIPGKVMVVLGKAEYIHKSYHYSRKILIARSLDAQIMVLWTGLLLGILNIFWLKNNNEWLIYAIIGFAVFSIFLFTPVFHHSIKFILQKIVKKNLTIPNLAFLSTIKALPVFLLYWITLSTAFYFLVNALTETTVTYWLGYTFPLAASLGIILLIAPGGLGIREGILTVLLHAGGVEIALATSIAVVSRLWFLIGESFLFVLAITLKVYRKNSNFDHKRNTLT